jgi:hypothetical protein
LYYFSAYFESKTENKKYIKTSQRLKIKLKHM